MYTWKWINGNWEQQRKYLKPPSDAVIVNYKQFIEIKSKFKKGE